MKIITANVYAFNREQEDASRVLEDSDAVAIGAQEAWRFTNLDGYSRHRGDGGRGALEVPIFLRKRDTAYLGHAGYRVTPDLGTSVAPDRWITWCRFRHDEHRFVLINTHVNAALQDRDTGELYQAARVEWAERHMRAVVAEVRRHRRDGFRPIVTGDFNYYPRAGQSEPWRWSPHVALTRIRMDYKSHRLDGIAVPSVLESTTAHDFDLPGSDHRAVSVHLDLPRKAAT